MYTITVGNNFSFDVIKKEVDVAFKSGIQSFTKAGAVFMKNSIPVKTGKLRDSIEYSTNSIWTTDEKYQYLDKGTKPHKIVGFPLVFIQNNVEIFTAVINHPGIKPHKITDGTEDYLDTKLPIVLRKINEVL